MDQRRLVERAREGDHDAFTELARDAVVRLDGAARLILRDPELARDAVQDALIRAWRDLPGLREPDRFDAWLHRLTVNLVLQERRSTMRRRERERADGERKSSSASPHRAIDAGVDLDKAIARLPARARTVLVLHDIEGYRHKEIARLMNTSEGTCKAQLHRARKMLREALS